MGNVLAVLLLILLVIAIIRELTCWYFKFSLMVQRLTEIRDILETLTKPEET
jgi:hypothetical protein